MGAKTPSKLKLRRPTYKCDECNKKFLSTQALKTHQFCVHKIKGNKKPAKAKPKLTSLLGKAVKKELSVRKKVVDCNVDVKNVVVRRVEGSVRKSAAERRLELAAKKAEEAVEVKNEEEVVKVPKKSLPLKGVHVAGPGSYIRKVVFECPQCLKMFSGCFSAYKHIQKFHQKSINEAGHNVPSSSSDLIKPVRVELCTKCNRRIRNNDVHYCSLVIDSELLGLAIECTGCQQHFRSIQLFDLHVSGLHCDVIDSLFFPLNSDFIAWKQNVEKQLCIKYLILGKCISKQTYRCTDLPMRDENGISYFCPSSIVVREYSKGIQVHFFKRHHGHTSPEYTIPERFRKFVITPLLNQRPKAEYDVFDKADEKDIYVQFKKLMDSIVIDAAKVNISTLKNLVGKALEMTTVLNSYDEESEVSPKNASKCMTDEQITKALETYNSKKVEAPKIKVKTKDDINSENTPKIINTFSLAKSNQENEIVVDSKRKHKQLLIAPKAAKLRRTPMKLDSPPPELAQVPPPIPPTIPPIPVGIIMSPNASTFNDSYKDFVDKNFKPPTESTNPTPVNGKMVKQSVNILEPEVQVRTPAKRSRVEVKKKIKTKIGQFKPSLSPKKVEIVGNKQPVKPATPVTPGGVIDLDYEVKEQENDYNILILKV